MIAQTIQQQVEHIVKLIQNQGLEPVAVMLGYEGWLLFSFQSEVVYAAFWQRMPLSAWIVQFLVRADEMNAVRVVTQTQWDEFAASHQIL